MLVVDWLDRLVGLNMQIFLSFSQSDSVTMRSPIVIRLCSRVDEIVSGLGRFAVTEYPSTP